MDWKYTTGFFRLQAYNQVTKLSFHNLMSQYIRKSLYITLEGYPSPIYLSISLGSVSLENPNTIEFSRSLAAKLQAMAIS